ncbi:MAG: EAL domain-containing protein [Propionivibrio sp.]|uniref:EAL domain-containing protein n=1 Tax=Propionivibrio sp. TaxID=2212460 RepID=UPI0025D4E376|nr:EAL domain-containing protein [Propionivibrio sp.]MBL0206799.1 EAL domain-containing protein [Propionivibrio sp.]
MRYVTRLVLLLVAVALPCSATEHEASLAVGRSVLTVTIDDNYPPYVFRDSDGALKGYLVDLWKLWEGKTGVRVDLVATDWQKAQQLMGAGQADVIDTVFRIPERDKTLDFTSPYEQISVTIFSHSGIGGITGPEDLRGFSVGVKAGDACIGKLKDSGLTSLQEFGNYEALVKAAVAGQIRVFCLDEPPANYLLYRHHAERDFNKAFRLYSGNFHRAVHKGDKATLALVNEGFASIPANEQQALHDKWMGSKLDLLPYGRYLAYALMVAALTGVLLAVWGAALRRRVRQRTAQLETEHTRLRVLLETIPDLVWLKDEAGVYLFCNPLFERLYGAKEAQIVGKTDYDFVGREQADSFREHDRKAQAAGKPTSNEEWITFADDGRRVLVETTKTPMHDTKGQLIGVLGVARDITRRTQAEQAVRESEERYRVAFRTSCDSVNINRVTDGCFVDTNVGFERMTGWRRDEVIGRSSLELGIWVDPEDRRRMVEKLGQEGFCENMRFRFRRKDGSVLVGQMSVHAIPVGGDECLLSVTRDITEQIRIEEALRQREQYQRALLDNFPFLVWLKDNNSRFLAVNQPFADACGQASAGLLVGKTDLDIWPCDLAEAYRADDRAVLESGRPTSTEEQIAVGDKRIWFETYKSPVMIDGEVIGTVGFARDITARKATEEEVRRLAFYDTLTHLPNRRLLVDRLQQAIASSLRIGKQVAVLFIDLDNFKVLNDTLGHGIGDLLLQQVAKRLERCVREGDTVARLGGDEFVVVLKDLSGEVFEGATHAEGIGEKILAELAQPYDLNGHEINSTPSIGITLLADRETTFEELMKRADMAMYQAKGAGRNTLRFFDPQMQAAVAARIALEADLRNGLRLGQLLLYYQPQVDGHGLVTGAEALVRWQHPRRGLVSPAEFIPLAEETGLILSLGASVLTTACQQLTVWSRDPLTENLTLAVNVSARQFRQPDFVEQVSAVLEISGADPKKLKLELTESVLLDNVEEIIVKMNALRACGVSFALDDFGTGYSSLSYLKRLPLNQLKIDQTFVRDVLSDPNDAAIARTIVALAQSLGLSVIAEGVETEAQREFLAASGCHDCQGYLFAAPMPIEQFGEFIGRK